MQLYEFILCTLFGFMLAKLTDDHLLKMWDYFKSPVGGFDFDWAMNKFLGIFSSNMAQRWYEAVAHVRVGRFLGALCAFGIIDVVRYAFMRDDGGGRSKTKFYLGYRSYPKLKKHCISQIAEIQKTVPSDYYFCDIFVCGKNVYMDYMDSFGEES